MSAHGRAETVDIAAIADGDIQGTNGFATVDTTDDLIRTSKSGGSESRAVFEFDLGSIPNHATIVAATFFGTFDSLSNSKNTANLTFAGFTGDGLIELSDATAAGTDIGFETFDTTTTDTDFVVSILNPGPIQSVLDDADANDFFTLRSSTENLVTWNVFGLESTKAGVRQPSLKLTFLVLPEPSSGTAAILTAALAVPWCRRRRVEPTRKA